MTLDQWLALCAICLLGAASPGPSLAVVLQSTLLHSQRAGVATALGHGFGVTVYALLTVSGLGLVVTELPAVYVAVRLTGAGYLLWLAVGAWNDGRAPGAAEPEQRGQAGFMRGMLVAVLNPKLAIFMLALFSQFVIPAAGPLHGAALVATAGIIDALWYVAVALTAGTLAVQQSLVRHAGAMNRMFSVLLAALALWVVATTLA